MPCHRGRHTPQPYLERAVFIQENVGRFKITVNDREGVNVLETNEHLIEKGLNVLRCQILRRHDEFVQIRIHICVEKPKL